MLGAVVVSYVQLGPSAVIIPFVVGLVDLVVMFGRRGWR